MPAKRSLVVMFTLFFNLPALFISAQSLKAVNLGTSELRDAVTLYTQELRSLERQFEFDFLPAFRGAAKDLTGKWLQDLKGTDFDTLSTDGRIDYILFENYLRQRQKGLEMQDKRYLSAVTKMPFLAVIAELCQSRRLMNWVDPQAAAASLDRAAGQVEALPGHPEILEAWTEFSRPMRGALEDWYTFYHTYDPQFDWWMETPFTRLTGALDKLSEAMNQSRDQETGIDGIRIGEAALKEQLAAEMIPYSPQELLAIGRKELDWCVTEMKKVSRELGFGDDWNRALEHVKQKSLPPGSQPETIRQMALDAVAFLDKNDLLTIPPMARQDWHIDMLSPRQQLMNPFFSGGEVIALSYPARTMNHDQKMMSLRGNNPHFCWATVHHELIPGHHLQGYMAERYNRHRLLFDTPFYVEGWPLYWEMTLWDMNFVRCAEDRVGMLFWRMHRCARIVFSLSYHLGLMSAEQCVDLLVRTVGHEPDNARAEVRRSFAGSYPPLYQAAYLLGGLQLRSLAEEVVKSGKMTLKGFHDAVLRENTMPIALLRAKLLGLPVEHPFANTWRFYHR